MLALLGGRQDSLVFRLRKKRGVGQRQVARRAGGEESREKQYGQRSRVCARDEQAVPGLPKGVHGLRSAISIWPGCAASIHGPPRSSTVPRTVTCWPASVFRSSPEAVKARSWRFGTVTVKSSDQRRPKLT